MRDAREHVRALELEAREEARLAKIKQEQAMSLGKKAGGLGRECSSCCAFGEFVLILNRTRMKMNAR